MTQTDLESCAKNTPVPWRWQARGPHIEIVDATNSVVAVLEGDETEEDYDEWQEAAAIVIVYTVNAKLRDR